MSDACWKRSTGPASAQTERSQPVSSLSVSRSLCGRARTKKNSGSKYSGKGTPPWTGQALANAAQRPLKHNIANDCRFRADHALSERLDRCRFRAIACKVPDTGRALAVAGLHPPPAASGAGNVFGPNIAASKPWFACAGVHAESGRHRPRIALRPRRRACRGRARFRGTLRASTRSAVAFRGDSISPFDVETMPTRSSSTSS